MFSLESKKIKRSESEIISDLHDAIWWMENKLELKVASTRIAKYEKYLSDKHSITSADDYKKFLLIRKELDEFLNISRIFSPSNDESLDKKIKNIISGNFFRFEAKKNKPDPSRDYLHELSVAAKLKKSGLSVDISGICDVVVKYLNKTLYIECKRVKSKSKLIKRIKEADKQIKKRVGLRKANVAGYITIDITDLLIPLEENYSILEYDDLKHFKEYSYELLKNYSNKYGVRIRKEVGNRVYGVVFFSHFLGVIKNKINQPVYQSCLYALSCNRGKSTIDDFNKKFFKCWVV